MTVDGHLLFSKRSVKLQDLFTLAEQWKDQMSRTGWTRVMPPARQPATVA